MVRRRKVWPSHRGPYGWTAGDGHRFHHRAGTPRRRGSASQYGQREHQLPRGRNLEDRAGPQRQDSLETSPRRRAPPNRRKQGGNESKKAFEQIPILWYSVFAFVALVSPLGSKAVARSHLRPFFCSPDRFAVLPNEA